ncbi:MAG TPA: BON domain-containing protein [Kofleriaceae bacterium]|nr:BON domain-containing protein [Kofleriaceae bacterium]
MRATVPDPDSSFRPTHEQEAESGEEFRSGRMAAQMTADEQELYARVASVLLGEESLGDIGFEVDRDRLILHGSVRDAAALRRIERLVEDIDGVRSIDNRIVVDAA